MDGKPEQTTVQEKEPAFSRGTNALAVRPSFDPSHRVICVTGAYSFLGREVLQRLEDDPRYLKVIAIDIRQPDLSSRKAQFFKVDLTLPQADTEIAHILRQEGADTLVHLAFLSKPTHNSSWAHELEAIGTLQLLNACAASQVRKVVMWSLTALYGPSPLNPNYCIETRKLGGVPGSRFFSDKLEAEKLADRFRKENPTSVVTILRTAPILGRRINNYVSQFLMHPVVPILLGYDPLVQFLHENDAVEAFKLSIDADFNDDYNVAGDGVLPLSTVLALAGKISLPVPHLLAYPLAKLLWMAQALDAAPVFLDFLRYMCVADTEKIRHEMGFIPRYTIQHIVTEFAGFAPSHLGSNALPEASRSLSRGELHV